MSSNQRRAALFAATNVPVDPLVGHSYDHTRRRAIHTFTGKMPWRLATDFEVPTAANRTLYGMPLHAVETRVTRDVEIAFTVVMPESRVNHANDDLPLIGLAHGVPTNRHWKVPLQRLLAEAGFITVAWDMLSMGESTQGVYTDVTQFAWRNDLPYIHELMTRYVPSHVGRARDGRWIFAADDWGGAWPPMYDVAYPGVLEAALMMNPISLQHPVLEIVSISWFFRYNERREMFATVAGGLPAQILGIEKYMVRRRERFNHATEASYIGQYASVDYTDGRKAIERAPHFWNLFCLVARATQLSPRQIQPFVPGVNDDGVRTDDVRAPLRFIWGQRDQMMSPAQAQELRYVYPNARYCDIYPIDGADHFVELDAPERVAEGVVSFLLATLGVTRVPVTLGGRTDQTFAGNERAKEALYARIFSEAPRVS